MLSYGVIGVGAIAEAIVTGLCEGVEDAPAVVLSPRNAETAARLAGRFTTVSVAADNQAVVDAAPVLLVCLRPQVARAALGELRFRPEQAVISAMAGIGVPEIERLVAPATDVARSIPLPAVAARRGITAIHPPNAAARALFDRLGESVELADLRAYDACAAATATIAAHFAYLGAIGAWMEAQDVPAAEAARYVASAFAELDRGTDFDHLARDHATAGGINELFLRTLREAGVYDDVSAGLDRVIERLSEL